MRAYEILLEDRIEYLKNTFNKKIERKLQSDNEAKRFSITSPDQLVDFLAQYDPDSKKRHAQWMVQRWLEGNLKLEDAYKAEDTFPKYEELKRKNKLSPEQKDIFHFKTIADIDAAIAPFEDTASKKDMKKNEYKKMEQHFFKTGQAELLYKGLEGKVIIPKTKKASCFFGQRTKWCTAATKSDNAFDDYNDTGPLYIMIGKDGKKWQMHIPEHELMNELDQPVKATEVPKKFLEVVKKYVLKGKLNLKNAYDLAYSLQQRIPEAEPYIMKNPQWAYEYAKDIIKGRWSEAEPYIVKKPEYALEYSRDIIKGRWSEAEPYIMKKPQQALIYAEDVIKGRWPEAEPYIMKDLLTSVWYAKDVIKGRWPEAEPYIMKDPWNAYLYANDVIKGRWPEAEPYIMTHGQAVVNYAKNIIKGRWLEAEPYIMKDSSISSYYRDVLGVKEWNSQ